MELLSFAGSLVFFSLPGFTLWHLTVNARPTLENRLNAIAFACALAITTLFFLTLASLNFWWSVWLVLAAASALYWIIRPWRRRSVPVSVSHEDLVKAPSPPPLPHRQIVVSRFWIILLFALIAAVWIAPTFFHEYPRGWDPYFHMVIVDKILAAQTHVDSLTPIENVQIQYPIGSHLFLATLSKITALPTHSVFKLAMAAFGILTALQVFSLVSTTTGRREVALFSTAAYALLAGDGSLGYYEWGGLPNLMAVYVLLGSLTGLARVGSTRGIRYTLPVHWVAISFLNHHALTASVFVLGSLLVYNWAVRRDSETTRTLVVSGTITALVLTLTLAPKILGPYSVADTGLLVYREAPYTAWKLAAAVGPIFLVLAMLGACVLARSPRLCANRVNVATLSSAVLVVAFLLFEYGGRWASVRYLGKDIAPLTPGRFLTDALPFLAVFAGVALAAFARTFNANTGAVLGLILLASLIGVPHYKQYFDRVIADDYVEAYRWIRANTAPDAIVLDEKIHAPYLAGRTSLNTPLPSSELWRLAHRRVLAARLFLRHVEPSEVPYPVVLLAARGANVLPGQTPLWEHPTTGLTVYGVGAAPSSGSASTIRPAEPRLTQLDEED